MDDNNYYLVINNYKEFGGLLGCALSYEDIYLKTTNKDDTSIKEVLPQFEEDIKSTIDNLKEINLGIEDDPHHKFIYSLLNDKKSNNMVRLLSKLKNCIAWTYKK